MPTLSPYISFNGNCREAMEYYHHVFGGNLYIQTFGEAPGDMPESCRDKIMHASVKVPGGVVIMGSDCPPGVEVEFGSAVNLIVNCDNAAQQDRWFEALSKGGVYIPIENSFWGARFGMCKDHFGVQWMLSFEE